MGLLLNVQGVSKKFGANPLFESLSFTVSESERIGLIGPNGAGKSTLLGMMAGTIAPDSGEVVLRKLVRVGFVAQESAFPPGVTVQAVLESAAYTPDEYSSTGTVAETLGRSGFKDGDAEAASLSGGWRKRLAIAEALVRRPDLLLLDEPTNHLDVDGIRWLERLLQESRFATAVVSHDRYFLENAASSIIEINRSYTSGLFRAEGNYSRFLERRDEYFEAQSKRKLSLANRVRTEVEWLRRGPKARATKAKARIDTAHGMIAELNDLAGRSRTATAGIDFTSTDRRSKRLIHAEGLTYSVGGQKLFENLTFTVAPGQRIGLVGPNGSGKTTLLRLLMGELRPESGTVEHAANLRIVYFDQERSLLDLGVTLRRALAPDGDSVVFQERIIHVASWAERFLFQKEQLDQPLSRLSGGERARVLIARLMLQPADVLLLDEPTNDLDIPTLEILEENLLEFPGALILVTHDRYLLDRVSTTVVGLNGRGGAEQFADYSQWEQWYFSARGTGRMPVKPPPVSPASEPKRKLSYKDARELELIEARIEEAEALLANEQVSLNDPAVSSDRALLQAAYERQQFAQATVDQLYARWAELEAKLAG